MKMYHASPIPFTLNEFREYEQIPGFNKPTGLWVSPWNPEEDTNGWMDWLKYEGYLDDGSSKNDIFHPKYLYELDIMDPDEETDLFYWRIDNPERARTFLESHRDWDYPNTCNWNMIARSSDAIIVTDPNYWWSKAPDMFYGWDCTSMCIFSLDIIRSIKLVEEFR